MSRRSSTGLFGLLVCFAAWAPSAARSQAPADAMAVLDAAAERYRSSSSLCADFRQELSVPLLDERRSGEGRMCQKQPNLFMMRFSEPAGDLVVADGEWLWIYFPSNDAKQVLRAPLGSAPGAFDFHREFLESPREKYTVRLDGESTVDGRRVHRLSLTPRGEAAYREALLWIDATSHVIRRVEIREENGNVRAVSLSNLELGADPGAAAFRFTPPPGTQVITR